jgi:hypothetical protein
MNSKLMQVFQLWLYLLSSLAIAVLSSSCLDQIELKNQRFVDRATIIQGRLVLSASTARVNVSVSKNGEFDRQEIGAFISGASVRLFDESGKSIALNEFTRNRNYSVNIPLNDPNFLVKVGKIYHLKVTLRDGKTFESTPETLLGVPRLEKVNFRPLVKPFLNSQGRLEKDTFMHYFLWTKLRPQPSEPKAILRHEVYLTYKFTDDFKRVCYCRESPRVEQILVYNGQRFDQERLDSFLFFDNFWDHRYAEGAYLQFVQESLSAGAYQYWEEVKKLSQRNGNLFDPPPGKISSNIKAINSSNDQVFGYFYATQHDTLPIFITPKAAGFPRVHCPLPPPTPLESRDSTICAFCPYISNSSRVKPKFWPQ